MEKTIMHIDFDSFFASCEQHFNPELRGKPIGVTAEHGRTCIIAASREAKKLGLKNVTRSWEAQKIVPDLILVPAHFEKYVTITQKFLNICKDFSPFVELFSIDETFIDLTPAMHLYPSLEYVVLAIKKRIRMEIGKTITATIGVSYNKLLAKLASSLYKPNGFGIIKREDVPLLYSKIEMTEMCGIGEALKIRLNMLGIRNFRDLSKCPMHILKVEFGQICAYHLKSIALGIDDSPVIPYYEEQEIKSVGRNYCLPKNEYSQEKILKTIYELSEEVAIRLRKIHKKAKTVELYLSGGRSKGERKTVGIYTNLGQDIFNVCKYLYDVWSWNSMVRRISVSSSNLMPDGYTAFDFSNDAKKEKLAAVVDAINEKFGDHTIRNAYLMHADKLTTKPNGYTKRIL